MTVKAPFLFLLVDECTKLAHNMWMKYPVEYREYVTHVCMM